jgi:hypothetical protein
MCRQFDCGSVHSGGERLGMIVDQVGAEAVKEGEGL